MKLAIHYIRLVSEATKRFFLFSLCMAAAGCNSPAPKLAHVELQTVNHTVVFNTGSARMSSYQIEHLRHFVETLPVSAISYVGLSANPADHHAAARSRIIRNYLIHEGVYASVIHTVPSFTAMDKQSLLLTVQFTRGIPPGPCPDWSKNSVANYNNTDMSNFGCSYNSNLAVQVADPADLDGGHAVPETEGPRDSIVVQKYMSDSPPPAGASSSTSSATSGGSGMTASP